MDTSRKALACLTVAVASAATTTTAPSASAAAIQPNVVTAQAVMPALPAVNPQRKTKKQKAKMRAKRNAMVRLALSRAGKSRYVTGAEGPYAFDCSGLTLWAYRKITGKTLPHNSAAQMRSPRVHRVARHNLRPGDLMFFGPGGSQHVSLYIGKNKMVGANNPRVGVVVESINSSYWRARYAGAGRLFR
jgi:cell wall-associated NlpC family hydrolase